MRCDRSDLTDPATERGPHRIGGLTKFLVDTVVTSRLTRAVRSRDRLG